MVTAPSPSAITIVLRLPWHHRALFSLLSPSFLLDHLLNTPLPITDTAITCTLFDVRFTLTLIFIDPPNSAPTPSTTLHLLPPLPPSLSPPLSNSPTLTLLSLSLTPPSIPLPSPNLFLAPTSHLPSVACTAHLSKATLIYLSPSLLLPHSPNLYPPLAHYVAAATAIPPAIILLNDAHLLFPPTDDQAACALRAALHLLYHTPSVVFVLCVADTPLHPYIRAAVDVVLGRHSRAVIGVQLLKCAVRAASSQQLIQNWASLSVSVGGLDVPRAMLERVLLWRRTRRSAFDKLCTQPANGVLLYGVPGTGKTALLSAAASAAGYGVVKVDATLLARGEVGASERILREAFERASAEEFCVIFLDEIEALFVGGERPHSVRLAAVLGGLMDGLEGCGIVVVGATNQPWRIAKGLLRAGRFEYCVRVALPRKKERREIARVYARKMTLEGEETDVLVELAGGADGFSGADIVGACRRAAMAAFCRRGRIGSGDLERAFRSTIPSVKAEDARRLDEWLPPG